MKEPMERLRSLERVITHLATVHPGLFADIPPGDMPEPETEQPVYENPPVPPEPEDDDQSQAQSPTTATDPPPTAVQTRGRKGGRS